MSPLIVSPLGLSHLEQDADGGSHAHHADAHHRHLVPAAHGLLLHDMADQLLLGGHLCKEKPVEEGEGLNKGTKGVVKGRGERGRGRARNVTFKLETEPCRRKGVGGGAGSGGRKSQEKGPSCATEGERQRTDRPTHGGPRAAPAPFQPVSTLN